MNPEALKGHLDLLLMAAVQGGPAHGYAIAEWLRSRSDRTFDLSEGTLYSALRRLEHDGVMKSTWSEVGGRRRRTYRLTARGESALSTSYREWRDFSRAVEAVVEGLA